MVDKLYDLIIIGGGPAGSSAAIYAARAGLRTLVLDKSMMSGALAMASKIVNYPGVPEEISGAELLQRMRAQAEQFGATFIQSQVVGLDLEHEAKTVYASDDTYQTTAVIIASGAQERKRKVQGEDKFLGRGVSYCATCDGAFFKDKEVAVIGNNDHTLEESLFLTRYAKEVHLVVPGNRMIAPMDLEQKVKENPKIQMVMGWTLREVIGNDTASGIRIADRQGKEELLKAEGVFIYLQGNKPSTEFLQGVVKVSDSGCIITDHDKATSVSGVFSIGDVCCSMLKQAVIAAAEGAIAAMAADRYINKLDKASPGRYY